MWDFPQYKFRERTFSGLSQGSLEVAGAGAGAEVGA